MAFFILPDAACGDAIDALSIGGVDGALRVTAQQFVRMNAELERLRMRNDELYTRIAALEAELARMEANREPK